MVKSHNLIIQKILEYGTLDDWRAIRDYFGIYRIAEECMKLRTLSPKALSFVCAMSDTKKENYRAAMKINAVIGKRHEKRLH